MERIDGHQSEVEASDPLAQNTVTEENGGDGREDAVAQLDDELTKIAPARQTGNLFPLPSLTRNFHDLFLHSRLASVLVYTP